MRRATRIGLAVLVCLTLTAWTVWIIGPAAFLPVNQGPGGVPGVLVTGIGIGSVSSWIARRVVR